MIQPLETGVVRAIHVQDGDHVKAGQVLIELDPTQTAADSDRLASDLTQAKLDVARLTAPQAAAETGRRGDARPAAGRHADRRSRRRAPPCAPRPTSSAAKVADLDPADQPEERRDRRGEAEIDKINASLPMLAEKANASTTTSPSRATAPACPTSTPSSS